MKAILWISLFFGCLALISAPTGRAQTSAPGSQRAPGQTIRVPELGQHAFMPSTTVRDPFIKTHIRNTLGIGQALDLNIPLIVLEQDTLLSLQGDLLFATLQFEYQHAVKDWLAVWVQVSVLGRLGTGVEALLSQGISAGAGFELGWMFRLWQNERMLLSGTLNLWNNNFTLVDMRTFVQRIIDEGEIAPDNHLVQKTPSVRGGAGLRYAWGISKLVGINLLLESGYGESAERQAGSVWFFNTAATIDFDLRAKSKIPIGLIFGYHRTSFPQGGDPITGDIQDFFWRLGYNGSDDFSLGLESNYQRLPLKSLDQTIKVGSTVISMRYYF